MLQGEQMPRHSVAESCFFFLEFYPICFSVLKTFLKKLIFLPKGHSTRCLYHHHLYLAGVVRECLVKTFTLRALIDDRIYYCLV